MLCQASTLASESRSFPARSRITRSRELNAIAQKGTEIRLRVLQGRYLASESSGSRVGLIVPKHGRSSVERNRLKRRLRELSRLRLLPVIGHYDLVIRARASAYAVDFSALEKEIEQVAARLRP